ncbi:MAG: hypothetical protein Kow0068_17550 [Marinilabiliales bacterium]
MAITTNCTIILILGGIVLRNKEIITFEKANTAITDIDITNAGSNLTVTASAEQIPNTNTVTGLLLFIGLVNNFAFFDENMPISFSFYSY